MLEWGSPQLTDLPIAIVYLCTIINNWLHDPITKNLYFMLYCTGPGLSKYTSVLERNFYIAGQKMPYLSEKLNYLHKISDTKMIPEFSL